MLLFIEDQESKLTFEDVRSKSLADFTISKGNNPNFGFKSHPVWARFDVKNQNYKTEHYFLEYNYPLVDQLVLYSPQEDGSFSRKTLGDRTPFDHQDIHARYPVFKLSIPPGEHTFYLKVQTRGSVVFPVSLASVEGLQDHHIKDSLFQAVLIGMIVSMAAYNLFLYFSFRTKVYLYYVVYMFCFALYLIGVSGISRIFILTEDSPHWLSNEGVLVVSEIYNIAMVLFTIEFLNLREKAPALVRFFGYYRIFQIFNILLVHFIFEVAVKSVTLSVFFTMSCMLYIGVRSALKGYRPAYYYTIAFCGVLVGNAIVAMKYTGIVGFNPFTNSVQSIGGGIEAVLLSLALGDRINFQRNKTETQIRDLNQELKTELKVRIAIVGDFAHRLNNPLNYLNLGFDNLQNQCNRVFQKVRDLLGDNSSEEARTVVDGFEQDESRINEITEEILKGVDLVSSSVEDIRNISGVDGYIKREMNIAECVRKAAKRLQIDENYRIHSMDSKTDFVKVVSNEALLIMSFDWTIRKVFQIHGRTIPLSIFAQEVENQPTRLDLIFNEVTKKLDEIEYISYMLSPLGIEVNHRYFQSQLVVSYSFPCFFHSQKNFAS